MSELMHLKESDSTIVDIYYTENFIVFETVNSSLYSRLIEGIYPNTAIFGPDRIKGNDNHEYTGINRRNRSGLCIFD